MPELRKDPILDRWVIIAQERASRPAAFGHDEPTPSSGPCPFCEGSESETRPEVLAVREPGTEPNTPGWRVRVVTNRYPALDPDAEPSQHLDGLYQHVAGSGIHDVIIEGAEHTRSVTELPGPLMREVLGVYRQRLNDISTDPHIANGVIIKNVGRPAGASIEHSHAQLIAPPVLPMILEGELEASRRYFASHGAPIHEAILDSERSQKSRLVYDGEEVVVFCPYAPRFPFETWFLPTRPLSHFEQSPDACLDELAPILQRVLSGIEHELNSPPYNYVTHSAPFREQHPYYRWRLEILPRITRVAGFEQATGLYINPISPEYSAEKLREFLG